MDKRKCEAILNLLIEAGIPASISEVNGITFRVGGREVASAYTYSELLVSLEVIRNFFELLIKFKKTLEEPIDLLKEKLIGKQNEVQ